MCDSMPILNDEFNFSDINLDFLNSPPRSKKSTTKVQNSDADAFPTSSQAFNEEDQSESETKIPQNSVVVQRNSSIQHLSKRIADVDMLVCQYREMEKERDAFRRQLEELQRSAKEIQTMYVSEKQKRMEEQTQIDELSKKCQSLDKELTTKTFEIDQLQAKFDGLKIPIEYDELAVRYIKLIQKLEDDRTVQRCEQTFVRDVQKYCKAKGLKVTPYSQRSPRKRKVSIAKVDSESQCNLEPVAPANQTAIQKELRDNTTQCERVQTRNQGCQYIGTTTTRSTTTACFFKYHDVGVNCNLLDFNNALNEILDDMRSWSRLVAPLSPIADLFDGTAAILPPPPPPIEMKNTGTCTFICNVQRSVDYVTQLPTIKRSNSRPSSRLMYETVKDESSSCPTGTGTTPSTPLDALNNRFTVGSAPTLYPSAFNELWQIFGHMLYGLLQRRADNGTTNTFGGQTIPESHVTNQQEFYNWLQNLYMDMHANERGQTHNQNQELQVIQNTRSTQENIIEGLTTTESTLDPAQQQQNQSCIESPLNFSNATPIKDTNSEQYLFKPKPQRSGNFPIEEDPMDNNIIDRQNVGTSPIRYMLSSPISSETDTSKSNTIENQDIKITQNRTPSAFTSPKSINQDPESKYTTETNEKLQREISPKKNECENQIIADENRKNCTRKFMESRGLKRSSTTNLNNIGETAVDFIAKLETFTEINEFKSSNNNNNNNNNEKIPSPINQTNFSHTTTKRKKVKISKKIQKLNHTLFGSETNDDDDTDNSESSVENNKKTEQRSLSESSMYKSSDCLSDSSYSDLSTDGSDNKSQTEFEQYHQTGKKRKRRSKFQNKTLRNCCMTLKGNKTVGNSSGTLLESDDDDDDYDDDNDDNDAMEMNVAPQKSPDSMNIARVKSSLIENQIRNELDKSKSKQPDHRAFHFVEENSESYKIVNTNIPTIALLNNVTKPLEDELKEKERIEAKNEINRINYLMEKKDDSLKERSSKTEKPCPVSFESPKTIKTTDDGVYEQDRTSSPLSDTGSNSSVDSRLIIVSDIEEETTEFDSNATIPKKRGRKRKSESASPNSSNTIQGVINTTPCKRSARLLAKQKTHTDHNFLSLLNVIKYTTRRNNHKEENDNIDCDEEDEQQQQHSDENLCEVMNTSNEETNHPMITIDESNHDEVSEKSENITTTFIGSEVVQSKNPLTSFVAAAAAAASSSPASPIPFAIDSQSKSVKKIPLERIEECVSWRRKTTLLPGLISVYEAHSYRSFNSEQFKADEKILLNLMVSHLNDHFSLNVPTKEEEKEDDDDDDDDDDAAVQLSNKILSTSQNLKLIAHAICSSSQLIVRPPTTEYENSENTAGAVPLLYRPIPSNINDKMPNILRQLIEKQPNLLNTLLVAVESILFNVQTADTLTVDAALNLTDIYLLTLSLQDTTTPTTTPTTTQQTQAKSNPARVFIAKCLYYHKIKAIPMIYTVLCKFPTTLPHREERNYDRSDALITVIQHSLMCTPYDMDKHQLFHRELLSKLRYVYHFEIYKPDFHEVLANLVEKLRAGKMNNLKYAMAIFCKRLQPERVVRDIIQAHMIPLSQDYYNLVQKTTEYDERTAALLDCFSFVVKPFPRNDDTLAIEMNNYLNIFKRFLSIVERPIVQEAAVHAILRLQRFSHVNCYNALIGFRPDYELHPNTRAALRTFIHRRPLSFWKALLPQSG